jgi:type I restriction enzyme S subunit
MTLLKDIIQIEKGRKYNLIEENQEGAIRVFQANDFRNENKPLYTLDADGVLAQEDDILLVWDGSVGQMGFGRCGYVGSTMVKLKVKNKKQFSPFFIYRFLQTKSEYLKRKATGATIMHINRKSLEQLEIPDLELPDQLHIANILSKAENLIAQRKESIRLLDEFLKSTFLEMFGDPVRNEKGWEVCNLRELGSLDRGVSKARPRNSPELLGGIYPLIQTGDVANAGIYITAYKQTYSELGLKQSKLWPKGTMLITIAANIARTSILLFDACFPDSVVGFVTNTKKARVLYVHFLFKFFQAPLESKASQTAQKNINLDILRNLKVPCPPISLQTQFAQIVEKTEALKTQYQQSLHELENLYGSLSQRAFRGELGVKQNNSVSA